MIRKTIVMTLLSLVTLLPANAQFAQAPAFPGAEGYGRYTTGGRGGKVYHVRHWKTISSSRQKVCSDTTSRKRKDQE